MCYTIGSYTLYSESKEVLPLKYWRGYLTAAIIAFFTWGLTKFAETHSALINMVYPYVTRMIQGFLAEWSGSVDFLLWQLLAIVLVVGLLATIVLMIVFRWNIIQWFGWVLAGVSLLVFLHTGVYGLNGYSGSIAEDIRLDMTEYSIAELESATVYYRNKANELAAQVNRDSAGEVAYSDFDTLAQQAGEGFHALVYDHSYPVFAGSTLPVKELGWADMYTSMGITGFTMSLTGEAAVNPQIPDVSLPFTMCHEMAHRMSIATESDANLTAYLACSVHPSVEYQYSAYFMAFRYCRNALITHGTEYAKASLSRVDGGVSELLARDMNSYTRFFASKQNDKATQVADTVNDSYIKLGGDDRGVASYGAVCDLLVNWHIQQVVLPQQMEEEPEFDPYDETQVDLTGIVNAKVPNE